MSTLPLLYSSRSLDKRPSKQGGIFALSVTNRGSNSRSMHINSVEKMESSPETMELTKNNITHYYFNETSKGGHKKSVSFAMHRYAKSNFSSQDMRQTSVVTPDTLSARGGEQIESVGALHRNIGTSIVLFNALLSNDQTQLKQLTKSLEKLTQKITNTLSTIQNEFKQKTFNLYNNLSLLRRQTLMQQKVNKSQVQKLIQDSNNTNMIMENSEKKMAFLSKECNI